MDSYTLGFTCGYMFSPSEKKELRGLAALGVINVVRPTWLEDCDRERKETPVLRKHIAYDLLLPKGFGITLSRSFLVLFVLFFLFLFLSSFSIHVCAGDMMCVVFIFMGLIILII